MRKTKILIYSILISAISFSEVIEVRDRDSFESAIANARTNDTIRLINDISIPNHYSTNRTNAVNNYDNYNIANGVTIDGNNHKLKIIGRNLSLNGDTTFKNINLVLALPNTTNDNFKDDIGYSAVIYANENNITLDNVKFVPDSEEKLSVAPTIIMGNEISKESTNGKVENTLTILNTNDKLRLKTIVAGSENKPKTSKSIIKIPSNVKLDMEGGKILLKNTGNVSNENLNVLVENSSREVRTFSADNNSNVDIVLDNVEYGFIKDAKLKLDGEIDNLTLKGATIVEVLDNTIIGTLNLKEDDEKRYPTIKVDKRAANDWGDDDYSLSNGESEYNGSLTVNKIVSNTDNAVIDLLNSATASVTIVEGNFKLKEEEDRNNFTGLPSDKGNPTVKDDELEPSGTDDDNPTSGTSTNTDDTEPKNDNENDVQPPSSEPPKEKEPGEEPVAPPNEDTAPSNGDTPSVPTDVEQPSRTDENTGSITEEDTKPKPDTLPSENDNGTTTGDSAGKDDASSEPDGTSNDGSSAQPSEPSSPSVTPTEPISGDTNDGDSTDGMGSDSSDVSGENTGSPTDTSTSSSAGGDSGSSSSSDGDTSVGGDSSTDVEQPNGTDVGSENPTGEDTEPKPDTPSGGNDTETTGGETGKADEDSGSTGDSAVTNDDGDASSQPSTSVEKDPKDDNVSSDSNGETTGTENGKDTDSEEQPATDASPSEDTKPDNGDQANPNEAVDGSQGGSEEKPKENDNVSGGGTIDNPATGNTDSGESSEPDSSDKPSVTDGNTASTTPSGEQPTVTDNTAGTSDTSVDKPDEEPAVQPPAPAEERPNTGVENTSTGENESETPSSSTSQPDEVNSTGETSTNGDTATTDPVVTPPEATSTDEGATTESTAEVSNTTDTGEKDTDNKQNEDDKQDSPSTDSDKVEEDEKDSNGEASAENVVVKEEKKELPHTRTVLNGNSSRVLSSVMNENYYILENNLRDGVWVSTSANVGRLGRDYKVENSGIFVGYNKEVNSNNYAIGFSYNNLGMKDKKDKLNSEMYTTYAHTDFKLDNSIFGITTSLGINKSKLKDDTLFGNKLMYGYEFNFKNIKIVPMVELRHLMVKEKSYELPEMKAKVDAKTVNYFNNMIGTKLSYTKDNLKLFTQIGVDINLKNKSEVRTLTVDGAPHINVNEKLDRVTNEFVLGAEYEMVKNLVLGLQYKGRYNSKKSSNDLKFFIKYTF